MAIKDWTNKSGTDVYVKFDKYSIPKKLVAINKIFVNNFPNEWEVKYDSITKPQKKFFKTKSQALRFAKKYMRSH